MGMGYTTWGRARSLEEGLDTLGKTTNLGRGKTIGEGLEHLLRGWTIG